jgi:hypothetical protein
MILSRIIILKLMIFNIVPMVAVLCRQLNNLLWLLLKKRKYKDKTDFDYMSLQANSYQI